MIPKLNLLTILHIYIYKVRLTKMWSLICLRWLVPFATQQDFDGRRKGKGTMKV